jgi:hypothetical protein
MTARTSRLLRRALTALCIVAACGDPPPAKAEPKADPPAKVAPTDPAPAADASKTAPSPVPAKVDAAEKTDAPAPADGKIGVAECDEYIEKYMKCIMERMPDKAKGYMKDAIDQSAKAWREAASGPSKDGVAAVCKVALDAAKQATTSLGCEW